MKKHKISIIVPVYNVKDYVERCVESIVNQTYKNIEIIVVNDGSTDESGKICEILSKRDERIKVFHKENGGLSDARNYGLKYATGDYIGFVDSDDYIKPKMFEVLYNNIIRESADVSEVDFAITDSKEYLKKKRTSMYKVFLGQQALIEFFKGNKIENSVWCKLYRKEVIEGLYFEKGITSEDFPFNFQVLLKANKVVIDTRDYYCYYYMREDSIINKKESMAILDSVFNCEKLEKNVPSNLSEHFKAKLIREKMKTIQRLNSAEKEELVEYREKFLDDIRNYSLIKACKYLSIKHIVTLGIMKISPGIYNYLYRKFQKQ